jgi:hypothetical protein
MLVARLEGRTAAVHALGGRSGTNRGFCLGEACGQRCGCESQSGGEEEGRKMHFCGYLLLFD